MLNHNQRSVNVLRLDLITALKENLAIHQAEYAEAVQDFRAKVLRDLKAKTKEVNAATDAQLVQITSLGINPPQNHETEFTEMIEMFEMSVDEKINLDHQSFKAFFKNDWPWKKQFEMIAASYKG